MPVALPQKGVRTEVMLLSDKDALYVGVRSFGPAPIDVDEIKRQLATYRTVRPVGQKDDGRVWHGEYLEIFVDANLDRSTYFQFAVNAAGSRQDFQFGAKGINAKWQSPNSRFVAAFSTDHWSLEGRIPFRDLGGATRRIGFNIARTLAAGGLVPVRRKNRGAASTLAGGFGVPGRFPPVQIGKPRTRVRSVSPADFKTRLFVDKVRYWHSDRRGVAAGHFLSRKTLSVPKGLNWRVRMKGRDVGRGGLREQNVCLNFDLTRLAPGKHEIEFSVLDRAGRVVGSASRTFTRKEATGPEAPVARRRLPLSFVCTGGAGRGALPVTFGVPFPRGALADAGNVRIVSGDGRETPCQVETTQRWSPQGAVRWALATFQPEFGDNGQPKGTYAIEFGTRVRRKALTTPLRVSEDANAFTVDTGAMRFRVSKRGFAFLDEVRVGGKRVVAGKGGGSYMVDHTGRRYASAADKDSRVVVEAQGPERVVLRAEGWYLSATGKRLGKYVVRIWAFRAQPMLRVFHTFILTSDSRKVRYRDIGLTLPVADPAQDAEFHLDGKRRSVKIATGRSVSLVQDGWQHLTVRENRGEVSSLIAEGKQADGIFSAGGVAVAVKDPWQNYPNELEVKPGSLTVHFWPAHGGPARHKPEDVTLRHLPKLWFCHEGKELDMQAPAWLLKRFPRKHSTEVRNSNLPGAVHSANAMGVAKTHELWLLFGDKTASERAAFNQAAQGVTGAHAPLDWVCASAAATAFPMHPRDPKRFPKAEALMESLFDFETRGCRYTQDYGMWNLGDGHTIWIPSEQRWSNWRIWRGYHHGSGRWPWSAYIRTGEAKYLVRARRNALHLADIDTCNYAASPLDRQAYPRGKLLYGLNDYKGLVHWHAGNRFFDYNNMIDFGFFMHHVTGVRRPREVVEGWLREIRNRYKAPAQLGRGLAGPISAMIYGLGETFDPMLLRPLQEHLARLLDTQDKATGRFHPSNGVPGYPWLPRYLEYTGSGRAKESLMLIMKRVTREPALWTNYNYHVAATRATGDDRYVRAGLYALLLQSKKVYRKPGHLQDGLYQAGNSVSIARTCYNAPQLMAALAPLGAEAAKPAGVRRESLVWTGKASWDDAARGGSRVLVLDEKDEMMSLGVTGSFRIRFPRKYDGGSVRYRLIAPEGALLREGTLPLVAGKRGRFEGTIEIAKDGKVGVYALEFSLPKSTDLLRFYFPFSGAARQAYASSHGLRLCWPKQRDLHFFVPQGTAKLNLTISLPPCSTAALVSPDGQARASAEADLDKPMSYKRLQCDVPANQAGAWRLEMRGSCYLKWFSVAFRSPKRARIALTREALFDAPEPPATLPR